MPGTSHSGASEGYKKAAGEGQAERRGYGGMHWGIGNSAASPAMLRIAYFTSLHVDFLMCKVRKVRAAFGISVKNNQITHMKVWVCCLSPVINNEHH